jgi:hypothetical protein
MHRSRRPRPSRGWVSVAIAALLLAVIAFLMLLPVLGVR